MKFVFVPIINMELARVSHHWNTHRLRHNRDARCPQGFPNQLYFLPHVVGCYDHKLPLDMEALEYLERNYSHSDPLPCEYWCYVQAINVMEMHNWQSPSKPDDGLHLYLNLLNHVHPPLN